MYIYIYVYTYMYTYMHMYGPPRRPPSRPAASARGSRVEGVAKRRMSFAHGDLDSLAPFRRATFKKHPTSTPFPGTALSFS